MKTRANKPGWKNRRIRANAAAEKLLHLPAVEVTLSAVDAAKPTGPRRFDVLAYTGGAMALNGYDLPVVMDLATMKQRSSLVGNLDHQVSQRVGHVDAVSNDGKQLRLGGLASAATPARDEVIASHDDGFKWQASIEASPGTVERVGANKSVKVNGQQFTGPLFVARGATLKGFAFASHGADDLTSVSIAATPKKDLNMNPEFKAWLAAKNWTSPEELTPEQLKPLQAAYDAEKRIVPPVINPITPPNADIEAIIAAEADNRERITAICKLTQDALSQHPGQAKQIEAMSRQAIEARESVRDFQCRLLLGVHPSTGQFRPRNNDMATNDVLEAALAECCKLPNIDAHYNDQTLQAAHDQYKHGLGMAELLLMAASQRGRQRYSMMDTRAVLEAVFRPQGELRAEFSTINVPGILSNVANKFLMDAFNAVESEWRKIAAIRSVRDFKEVTSYSLTGDLTYKELGPKGEIKHGTLGEQTYGNKAKTYARMLSLERTDLINDDLHAFKLIQKRLGRGGALAINHVFWTAFLDNADFFTSGRGNYDDGTDTVFGADGVDHITQLFAGLTDPDGNPLGAVPKLLVVPPAHKVNARRLMASTNTTQDSALGSNNPWAGVYEVISSVYMGNVAYAGATMLLAYYLLADPEDLPCIEACFLNGVETPTVESTDADFEVLGIKFRGIHDFGMRKQEYRAGVKVKGAT